MSDRGATRILAATAFAGLAGAAATGPVAGWERFWINWIQWFLFLLTIGLGCLFIVALEHVVGALGYHLSEPQLCHVLDQVKMRSEHKCGVSPEVLMDLIRESIQRVG